jgi:hypothetical protein
MIRVHVSTVINAPVATVWDHIRDYNQLPRWVPAIVASEIEDGRDSSVVGCVRKMTLGEGGIIRERLLALSDRDHQCTYAILDSPLPVQNYVATVKLVPITDGDRTYASWTAEFDTDQERAMRELIGQGVFMTGFNSLKQTFGG